MSDSYEYSYEEGQPQVHIWVDASSSTKNHMYSLPPNEKQGCIAMYERITGKRMLKVTRLMYMLWHLRQIAASAAQVDFDGILTIHFLSTDDVIEIPKDESFEVALDDVFRHLLTKRQRGSAVTRDFTRIVKMYLEEDNPYTVVFYTDGELTDQEEFFEAYARLAPKIVAHGGDDADFGVFMMIASDRAEKLVKGFKGLDDGLPDGTDLMAVADLRTTPADMDHIRDQAANG
jgi:hypothetical protein